VVSQGTLQHDPEVVYISACSGPADIVLSWQENSGALGTKRLLVTPTILSSRRKYSRGQR
jgi:hypothetical protein